MRTNDQHLPNTLSELVDFTRARLDADGKYPREDWVSALEAATGEGVKGTLGRNELARIMSSALVEVRKKGCTVAQLAPRVRG